jgi:hypothetical protein
VTEIGPVQLMSIGFPPGANFEGRIAEELAKLEGERTIRVLDLLFVARDTDSEDLVVLEHQEESMGVIVGRLLGIQLDDPEAQARSFGFSDAGGRPLGGSFLTPESIATVEPELAAMAAAIEESQREGTSA